jgi:uncharacterized protein YjbI with pentapeptide repeats
LWSIGNHPTLKLFRMSEPPIEKPADEISPDEEVKFRMQKLAQELKFLKYQTSSKYLRLEYLKALSGIGSVLAAIFTFGAVMFSVIKWSDDNKQARIAREDDRFSNALAAISDPLAQKRLGAAITLKSYIDQGDKVKISQVVLSLTNALAYENNATTRNGILDVLRSLDFDLIDSATQTGGLKSLINLDKSLAHQLDLFEPHPPQAASASMDAIEGLSAAIGIFLKHRVFIPDMSNIFLDDLNLPGIQFPSKTDFSNSTIIDSDLDSSTCVNCNFQDCNLNNSTFRKANLKNANFSYSIDVGMGVVLSNITRFHWYAGPHFDSANIEGALFTNYPLFYFKSVQELPSDTHIYNSNFDGADMANANFMDCLIYTATSKIKEDDSFMGDSQAWIVSDSLEIKGYLMGPELRQKDVNKDYLKEARWNFSQSNWKQAKLPPFLEKALEKDQF